MIEKHLQKLIEIGNVERDYIGNNSWNWAKLVLTEFDEIDPYLDRCFDRYELFSYCSNKSISNKNLLIAILSWGGMRRDHGRLLFQHYSTLDSKIDKLRNGIYKSRKEAFLDFYSSRINGDLPGLGIGFITKLICFLNTNLNGYIMDQWVGKSVNLLEGDNIVIISNNSWVNDSNDAETYEVFCSIIDDLSIHLKCSGFEAEKQIFSIGGHNKGRWRKYLIENYKSSY